MPALEAMDVQNKISGFQATCNSMSRDNARGDVMVARYVFEPTVPGAGVTAVDMTTVLKFCKVAGQSVSKEIGCNRSHQTLSSGSAC